MNIIDNKVRESAAKLDDLTNHLEGSETIPKGSTSINPNIDGSARPLTGKAEGEEIVHGNLFYKEYFISLANEKFSNKFDYSLVEYKNVKEKVKIICPIHGEYLQSMEKHISSKYGCPKCANVLKKRYDWKTYLDNHSHPSLTSLDEFLEKANKKYNNKFTYITDNLEWNGKCNTTIKIICPIHGEFELNCRQHLDHGNHSGCPKCANDKRAKSKTKTYDLVIDECKSVYGDKYIFPEENRQTYINKCSLLKIICPEHGVFYKKPIKFIAGQECHHCRIKQSKLDGKFPGGYYSDEWFNEEPLRKEKPGLLYYFKILNLDTNQYIYKIGITTESTVNGRIKHLKYDSLRNKENLKFELVNLYKDTLYNVYKIELEILLQYKEYRIFRKWSSELFKIDIYDFIKQYF